MSNFLKLIMSTIVAVSTYSSALYNKMSHSTSKTGTRARVYISACTSLVMYLSNMNMHGEQDKATIPIIELKDKDRDFDFKSSNVQVTSITFHKVKLVPQARAKITDVVDGTRALEVLLTKYHGKLIDIECDVTPEGKYVVVNKASICSIVSVRNFECPCTTCT